MSMILILESVSADVAVENHEPTTIPFNSLGGWSADMLVGADEDEDNMISLEKAWHGLHFLLTGDPWGGSGYEAFLLCGGTEQGEDMGYGPARFFDVEKVREIHNVLDPITTDQLWSRFDAHRMAQADIYGAHWDDEEESDLKEEYLEYFEMLKQFISQIASEGNSLRITMS
jgi:hypothetical protein